MQKQPALVGIIPRKELWQLIQKERWYHIPVESIHKDIFPIKYLAFYFPECFDKKNQHKIIYYAKVLNIETVKRIQLFPKELKHERAQKNYYKLYLDQINKLPQIIPCKRIIIHIQTNKQKLFTAKNINDLWDTNQFEERMYQAMKKQNITTERQFRVKINDKRYFLDFGIFCRKGNINLECDGDQYHTLPDALAKDRERNNQLTSLGWHILRFSNKEIYQVLQNCLETVKRTIYTLGGLKQS
ncbi:MAG: DUF559 domain-containing protein [Patescibacteria group bacterium]